MTLFLETLPWFFEIILMLAVYFILTGLVIAFSKSEHVHEWNYFLILTAAAVIILIGLFMTSVYQSDQGITDISIQEETACLANLEQACNVKERGTFLNDLPPVCNDVSLENVTRESQAMHYHVNESVVCS